MIAPAAEYGLSKMEHSTRPNLTCLASVGDKGYAAPEQIRKGN
jgi:hypothetical protein